MIASEVDAFRCLEVNQVGNGVNHAAQLGVLLLGLSPQALIGSGQFVGIDGQRVAEQHALLIGNLIVVADCAEELRPTALGYEILAEVTLKLA